MISRFFDLDRNSSSIEKEEKKKKEKSVEAKCHQFRTELRAT